MSDEEILAGLLKRFTEGTVYYFWAGDRLTLDGTVPISPDEALALERATGKAGGDWWETRPR